MERMTTMAYGSRESSGGLFRLILVAVTVALIAAACSAQAQGNDQDDDENDTETSEFVAPEAEVIVAGNQFQDDFRAEYRLKYGESDLAEDDSLARPVRETYERLVNDGSNYHIVSLTFPLEEDGQISGVPWHTHPGPVVVGVVEGALTITWEIDCEPRTYQAGEAFVDLGEDLHIAENLAGEETVVYISAIGIPEGEPVTEVVVDRDDFEEPC